MIWIACLIDLILRQSGNVSDVRQIQDRIVYTVYSLMYIEKVIQFYTVFFFIDIRAVGKSICLWHELQNYSTRNYIQCLETHFYVDLIQSLIEIRQRKSILNVWFVTDNIHVQFYTYRTNSDGKVQFLLLIRNIQRKFNTVVQKGI